MYKATLVQARNGASSWLIMGLLIRNTGPTTGQQEYCTFQTVSSGRLIVTRDLPIGSPVIGSPTYVMRDSEPIGPAIVHLCGYLRGFPAR